MSLGDNVIDICKSEICLDTSIMTAA